MDLSNINLPSCIWFEQEDRKNAYVSMIAGLLFFTGWWCAIDVQTVHPEEFKFVYHLCGIAGTISLIMVNTISNSQVTGDGYVGYEGGLFGTSGARVWFFVGFVLGFASVIAASWILFADFTSSKNANHSWTGVGLFMQNFFIFFASIIFKFGRSEEHY